MSLQISLRGELCLAEITVVGPVSSVSASVNHQVALAGKPGLALLLFALERLSVLPPVAGETGGRGAGLLTDLTLIDGLHCSVTLRD